MKTNSLKTLLASGLIATLLAPLSQAQITDAVYSVNIIGMQKQTVVQDRQLMSNPFEAMTIRELVGNSGVFGTSQDVADNFSLYDTDTQTYLTYYLRSHSSVGIEWRRGTQWATNVYVYPHQSFFYLSRATAIRTNMTVGDVVLANAVTNTIKPGLQLISYPFSTGILLSEINIKNGVFASSQDLADNVSVYDSELQTYLTYYLRSHSSVGIEWRRGTSWATNVFIEAGQGLFFRSRATSSYEWVESSPYPDL